MLNKIKLISWLDQMREIIAKFQGFTHILLYLSQIILFMSISKFGNESQRKSNLHIFDLYLLYLSYIRL